MNKKSLCFRTFAEAIRTRMDKKARIKKLRDGENDKTEIINGSAVFVFYSLLLEAVLYTPVQNEEPDLPDVSKYMTTQLKQGKEEVHGKISEIALRKETLKQVSYFFAVNIVPNIPLMNQSIVLDAVEALVQDDDSIGKTKKSKLKKARQKNTPADYLAEVFLLSICNSNKEAAPKIPADDDDETESQALLELSVDFGTTSTEITYKIPYRRNPNFTGRELILSSLKEHFSHNSNVLLTQTVSGLGGIGKTQTALEYAYSYAHEYKSIWWANAETVQTLVGSYRLFAKQMKISDMQSENDLIQSVRNWFDAPRNSGWLIIYDNVDNFDVIEDFTPISTNGHILATTRLFDVPPRFDNKIDIAVFEHNEAVAFLNKRIKREDKNAAEVSRRLGYLPLALEQAAAYIHKTKETFAGYLELLHERGLSIFEEDVYITDYKKTINATWGISIEKIAKESKSAYQLFNLCAYFSPERIPIQIFIDSCSILPDSLSQDIPDRLLRNRIISAITRYSLMLRNSDNLSMHRLLQEVVRNNISGDTQWILCCIEIARTVLDYQYGDANSMRRFEQMVPHILDIADHATKLLRNDESALDKTSFIYGEMAGGFVYEGQYSRALDCYFKCLSIYEETIGRPFPQPETLYFNIASTYSGLGDYKEALDWYDKTLKIRAELPDNNPADIADVYNRMSMMNLYLENPDEALKWAIEARDVYEDEYGSFNVITAEAYSNMSVAYMLSDDCNKAMEWQLKVIEIREKEFGLEHPDTASAYTNIGMIYDNTGDYSNALKWHFKALRIYQHVLGDNHHYTAAAYNNIALVFNHQGKYEKALEWHFKDMHISEISLGVCHPKTAICYTNIGLAYHKIGRKDETLKWYLKAYLVYLEQMGVECDDCKVLKLYMEQVYDELDMDMSFNGWLEGHLPIANED